MINYFLINKNKEFILENNIIINKNLLLKDNFTLLKLNKYYNENINIDNNKIFLQNIINIEEIDNIENQLKLFNKKWEEWLLNTLKKNFYNLTLQELRNNYSSKDINNIFKQIKINLNFQNLLNKYIQNKLALKIIEYCYNININNIQLSLHNLNNNIYKHYINLLKKYNNFNQIDLNKIEYLINIEDFKTFPINKYNFIYLLSYSKLKNQNIINNILKKII